MFGEVTLEIGGVDLALEFKTKNLRKLQALTGKNVFSFLAPFNGAAEGDLEQLDYLGMLVPVLQAGLATHPKMGKRSDSAVEDKVSALLDAEAAIRKQGVVLVAGDLLAKVVAPLLESIVGPNAEEAEPESGNAGEGEATK